MLKYLARYTHRVAIANSRITAADADAVSFATRTMRVATVNRARKQELPLCRQLIARATGHDFSTSFDLKACLEVPDDEHERCPVCHAGTMRRTQTFDPQPTWEFNLVAADPPTQRDPNTRTPSPSEYLTRLCMPPCRCSSAPARLRYRDLPANRATTPAHGEIGHILRQSQPAQRRASLHPHLHTGKSSQSNPHRYP